MEKGRGSNSHEDDGSVPARNLETGLVRGAETRSDALTQLAEVLRLESGGREPIGDPDKCLREEMDIDTDDPDEHDELSELMQ